MLELLLILFGLVSACVAIHGAGMVLGLRWLGVGSTMWRCRSSLPPSTGMEELKKEDQLPLTRNRGLIIPLGIKNVRRESIQRP